ncbi:MAG: hypothetical protein K1W14_06560 [Muribaculaceae bacterium]|jgi:hypothetical protein
MKKQDIIINLRQIEKEAERCHCWTKYIPKEDAKKYGIDRELAEVQKLLMKIDDLAFNMSVKVKGS